MISEEVRVSGTQTTAVGVCEDWYKAFDSRDLDKLMGLFTAHPIVVIGSGGSHSTVPYHGSFEGYSAVRRYYKLRFAEAAGTSNPGAIRPYCAISRPPCVFDPWVVFSGKIQDHPEISPYGGTFLHVFRFGRGDEALKIAALEMFLDPAAASLSPAPSPAA
jgi:SnoaL-like domain